MRAAVLAATVAALAAPRAAPAAQNTTTQDTSAAPAPAPAQATTRPRDVPATRAPAAARGEADDAPGGNVPSTMGVTVPELLATLSAPNALPAGRREAAQRLVARQSDEAREALRQVVTSVGGNLDARIAALRALADDANPSPRLLNDLLGLLSHEDARLLDADAQALTAYKRSPQVVDALSAVAVDAKRNRLHRISATRALGLMPEQPAAAALVRIVTSPDENADVAAAAADALVDMTGLEANGRDPARWAQWLRDNGSRPPAEWTDELLPARAARDDRLRRRGEDAAAAQYRLLQEVYDATPADEKPRRLLRFLNDPSPDTRRHGARIADRVVATTLDAAKAKAQITEPIQLRLVELIGDADPGVRLDALRALEIINVDAGSLLAVLLPQLRIETDSNVKAAMARKLSLVPNLEAVPDLLRLLDDASPAVVRAAADALKRRAPALLQNNPGLAKQTAERLRATMQRLAGRDAFLEARRACGEALAAFKDPKSLQFSRDLQKRGEPPAIRGVGLMILGEIGAAAAPDITSAVDNERDPKVRVEGIKALAATGTFDQSDWLFQKTNDPDPEVRQAAEAAYRTLLPKASLQKLVAEADRRKNNPAMRIDVLKALVTGRRDAAKAAEAAGRHDLAVEHLNDAALQQYNIGAEYLRNLKPTQPDQAVPYLRAALDYMRRERGLQSGVTKQLVNDLILAMLQSRQYEELATFAEDLITSSTPEDASFFRGEIGPKMRNEADALVAGYEQSASPKPQEKLVNASALIKAALDMPNALDPPYRKRLTALGVRVEELRASAGSGGTR